MAPTNMKDDATVAVASVIHQDVNPEMGRIPDPEGCSLVLGFMELRFKFI